MSAHFHLKNTHRITTDIVLQSVVLTLACRVRDFYHTCYCLSGLSVAQNFNEMNKENVKVIGRNENLLVGIS